MITIELSENEVGNLLVALNSVPVQGEERMIAVLQLAQKLRRSAKESLAPAPEAPALEAPKEE
jgi:hypothetical protein